MVKLGRVGNLVFRRLTNSRGDDLGHTAWFWCPGCDEAHLFEIPRWQFDGNYDAPSFSPSLLRRDSGATCHLFLRRGVLEFLSDCSHRLASQCVPLPEPPDWL